MAAMHRLHATVKYECVKSGDYHTSRLVRYMIKHDAEADGDFSFDPDFFVGCHGMQIWHPSGFPDET